MSDRPRWQVPVLVLAILLVVGQVVVFVAIRGGKDAPVDAGPVALAPLPQGSQGSEGSGEQPPPLPQTPPLIDARAEVSLLDATVAPAEPVEDPAPPLVPAKKKVSRAELAAEKKRQEQEARDARETREARERKQEQERIAADREKINAELERQRLATQKAEAEAAAAKAAAEKARLEAIAKSPEVPAVTAKPAADVLVLVLGPGTPSVSSEQIKAVYLGRTTVWPNGTTARPFNRPGGSPAARKFYGAILRMNGGEYAEHWSEIQLSGNGIPPQTAGSGANAVAKVAGTTGGFTYVMESELPANVSGVRLVRLK